MPLFRVLRGSPLRLLTVSPDASNCRNSSDHFLSGCANLVPVLPGLFRSVGTFSSAEYAPHWRMSPAFPSARVPDRTIRVVPSDPMQHQEAPRINRALFGVSGSTLRCLLCLSTRLHIEQLGKHLVEWQRLTRCPGFCIYTRIHLGLDFGHQGSVSSALVHVIRVLV